MKKERPKEPYVPRERHETVRKEIAAVIEGSSLSAKEISAEVKIPEKEVFGHLEHIRLTLENRRSGLLVDPAECVKCGFVFRKRERLRKPGKCPVCKSEHITEPRFSIRRGNPSEEEE